MRHVQVGQLWRQEKEENEELKFQNRKVTMGSRASFPDFLKTSRLTTSHCTSTTLRSDCTHSASWRNLVLVVLTCIEILHRPFGG